MRAVAEQRGVQQDLVRGRSLAALLRELHVERDLVRPRPVGPVGIEDHPDAGLRIDLEDDLIRPRTAVARIDDVHARRMLEPQAQLGLRRREALARADEERDTGPAPVVDLEP
jgi:hypothetical protein